VSKPASIQAHESADFTAIVPNFRTTTAFSPVSDYWRRKWRQSVPSKGWWPPVLNTLRPCNSDSWKGKVCLYSVTRNLNRNIQSAFIVMQFISPLFVESPIAEYLIGSLFTRNNGQDCTNRSFKQIKLEYIIYTKIYGNKMPTRCNRWFLLQILLLAQHVSGTIMSIIRSSIILYRWLLQ
jgi:hypothetical protein